MKKQKITSFIRTKMVKWMIEIFYTFNSNEETFLAAVDIMDKYIYNYYNKVLTYNNIHFLGFVSVYIVSKVYDLISIQLDNKEKSQKMKMKLLLKFNMLKSVEKMQEICQFHIVIFL